MNPTASSEAPAVTSPVLSLLTTEKRERFERYWLEYADLSDVSTLQTLRLQADIAAGVMLPARSALHPSTALAVAAGLLQYQPTVGEGLAGAFTALTKLRFTEPLPPPLGAYVTYALEELSHQFHSLGTSLAGEAWASKGGSHAHSS